MRQYLDMLKHILENGEERPDRTGTGTISTFGYQTRYDLKKGFPLMTTKRILLHSVIGELLWFLSGSTNATELEEKYGSKIWKDWAGENGELGPVYGKQWRSWDSLDGAGNNSSIDQISQVIESIQNDPYSRRHIVSAWNVADIDKMALPPCHLLFQFYVSSQGELSCQLYQRSADSFLGVPFNIASYSLLVHMIAHVTGLKVGEFIHTIGDAHIYKNHTDQVKEQLRREPKELPRLVIKRNVSSIFDFRADDFEFEGYDPHPFIKAPVSV